MNGSAAASERLPGRARPVLQRRSPGELLALHGRTAQLALGVRIVLLILAAIAPFVIPTSNPVVTSALLSRLVVGFAWTWALIAVVALLLRGGLSARLRRAWMWMGAAAASALIFDLLIVRSILGGPDIPVYIHFFAWSFFGCALVSAVLMPPRTEGRSAYVRLLLDIGVVWLACALLLLFLVLRVSIGSETGWGGNWIDVMYLLGEGSLGATLAVVALRPRPAPLRLAVALLAVGFLAEITAQVAVSYEVITGAAWSARAAHMTIVLCTGCVAEAALLIRRHAARGPIHETDLFGGQQASGRLPYFAVATAFLGAGAVVLAQDLGNTTILVVLALLALVFLAVRYVLALRENVNLVAEAEEHIGDLRFRSLVQHSSDLVAVVNDSGHLAYVSPAIERIAGIAPDAAVGRSLLDLVAPANRDELSAALAAARAGLPAITLQAEFRGGAGDATTVELAISRPPLESDIAGLVLNGRDVTDRVALESLQREQHKLEATSRLSGSVAHNFNNLLTVISGCAQMALDPAANREEVNAEMEEVLRAARMAAGLTQQFLELSGSRMMQTRPFDVGAVVRELTPLLESYASPHRLVVDAQAALPRVGDPRDLELVLLNLVLNAHDAIPDLGTIRIHAHDGGRHGASVVLAGTVAPATRYHVVEVQDDGAGIAPEDLARIVEPFFTTSQTGNGLGLHTVREIALRHNGWLAVHSVVGEGTLMQFGMPA